MYLGCFSIGLTLPDTTVQMPRYFLILQRSSSFGLQRLLWQNSENIKEFDLFRALKQRALKILPYIWLLSAVNHLASIIRLILKQNSLPFKLRKA